MPARVLAQVWRDGSRQARLAALIGSATTEVVALDESAAKAAGRLCAIAGSADPVDASVVVAARVRGDRVVTSDPKGLGALDPQLELLAI